MSNSNIPPATYTIHQKPSSCTDYRPPTAAQGPQPTLSLFLFDSLLSLFRKITFYKLSMVCITANIFNSTLSRLYFLVRKTNNKPDAGVPDELLYIYKYIYIVYIYIYIKQRIVYKLTHSSNAF